MQNSYKVYVHINKINHKLYFGQTCCQNVNQRYRHGKGYIKSPHFYSAIQKYGWDAFEHIIIIDNLTKEEANVVEFELIKKYKTTNKNFGYNILKGGDNRELSEETKEKIRITKIGNKNPMYNHNFSEEHRERLSTSLKGRRQSEEWINKRKMFGKRNPMYGKIPSEETRRKISEANKGENNPMYGVSLTGRTHNEEVRRKIGLKNSGKNNGRYGYKYSDEELQHLREINTGDKNGNAKSCKIISNKYNDYVSCSYMKDAYEFINKANTYICSNRKIGIADNGYVYWIFSDLEVEAFLKEFSYNNYKEVLEHLLNGYNNKFLTPTS